MSSEASKSLINTVNTIVAITGAVKYDGTTGFRHLKDAYSVHEHTSSVGLTRSFVVRPVGAQDPAGPAGQQTAWQFVNTVLELEIGYRVGVDAYGLLQVLADDFALLHNWLARPTEWDAGTTYIANRTLLGFSQPVAADTEEGDAVVVTAPIEIFYLPRFDS